MHLRCAAIVLGGFLALGVSGAEPVATLEDPEERAALPEFKTIPAARPDELTPAIEISAAPFSRWTRSQGDNGARRYSALQQITRDNV